VLPKHPKIASLMFRVLHPTEFSSRSNRYQRRSSNPIIERRYTLAFKTIGKQFHLEHKIFQRIPSEIVEEFINFCKSKHSDPLVEGWSVQDSVNIILYWMLHHGEATCSNIEIEYNIDKNAVERILEKLYQTINEWNELKLRVPSFDEMEQISRRYLDQQFHNCTCIIDGVDCPIEKPPKSLKFCFQDSFLSKKYKYKFAAVRYQVCITSDKQAFWICEGNPAGAHDMRCLWRSNFHQIFGNNSSINIIIPKTQILNLSIFGP
jgi:hypothetical protein